MALALFHLNPKTERIGKCSADRGRCPFGTERPHFVTREEVQSYYEGELEAEYGLFGDGELDLSERSVARRLNILPDDALEELIRERFRRGGYTPREADSALKGNEPFYAYYTGNQEITLDPYSARTQQTFLRGACAVFARTVHRATGWPMVVYSDRSVPGYWQGHVTVRTPDGKELDIRGALDDPLAGFAGTAKWTVTEAKNADELREQTADREEDALAERRDLELLERFAVAKLAFEILQDEGYLQS